MSGLRNVWFGRKLTLWINKIGAQQIHDAHYRDHTENIIGLSNCKKCGKLIYPQDRP
jgi:uncharacterized OB-fold protein